MEDVFVTDKDAVALPVWPVGSGDVQKWCDAHAGANAAWVGTAGFTGEAGRVLMLPNEAGGLAGALLGIGKGDDPFIFAALSESLPAGTYRLAGLEGMHSGHAAFAWALGTYSFSKYKSRDKDIPRLILPEGIDLGELSDLVDAVFLTRDLVNAPTNDLGPAELETAIRSLAEDFDAPCSVILGDDLLSENYPMVHAVGRAAAESAQPRLIDFGLAILSNQMGGVRELAGTLPYMSPEQTLGGLTSVGASSDVYSLAVTAYELLTGDRVAERAGKIGRAHV